MKKKFLTALLVSVSIGLIGCGTSNQTKQDTLSSEEIDARIEKAISTNNEELKKDLLKTVDKQIDDKISGVNSLTEKEKNDLRNSIMDSIKNEMSQSSQQNSSTTEVIKQPIQDVQNFYSTQVSNSYITNEIKDDNTQENEDSTKIVDGTLIPITNSMPFEYNVDDVYLFSIDSATVTAYNHSSEPYREYDYPYELRISISGTYEKIKEDWEVLMINFGYISLYPYGSTFEIDRPQKDENSKTFTVDTTIAVNQVPEQVTFNLKK